MSDRIYRTGDIPVPVTPGEVERSISFYTNALDVEHSGLDIVATSVFDWSNSRLNLALAYAYNKVEVTGQKLINGGDACAQVFAAQVDLCLETAEIR